MERNEFDVLSYEEKVALIAPGTIWANRETGRQALVLGYDGETVKYIELPIISESHSPSGASN